MPDSLDSLRDIHVPDPVSWWPLAYGYWVLLALLLVAAVLWWRRYQRFAVRRAASRELNQVVLEFSDSQNSHELARKINVLLRRAVLSLEPRNEVASLTGHEWITQVEACTTKTGFTFSEEVARLLTRGVYQASADVDPEALLRECRAWVRALPPRLS